MRLVLIGLRSTRRRGEAGEGVVELAELLTVDEHLREGRSPLRVTLTGDAAFAEGFCPGGDLDPAGFEVDLELTVRRRVAS